MTEVPEWADCPRCQHHFRVYPSTTLNYLVLAFRLRERNIKFHPVTRCPDCRHEFAPHANLLPHTSFQPIPSVQNSPQ